MYKTACIWAVGVASTITASTLECQVCNMEVHEAGGVQHTFLVAAWSLSGDQVTRGSSRTDCRRLLRVVECLLATRMTCSQPLRKAPSTPVAPIAACMDMLLTSALCGCVDSNDLSRGDASGVGMSGMQWRLRRLANNAPSEHEHKGHSEISNML